MFLECKVHRTLTTDPTAGQKKGKTKRHKKFLFFLTDPNLRIKR